MKKVEMSFSSIKELKEYLENNKMFYEDINDTNLLLIEDDERVSESIFVSSFWALEQVIFSVKKAIYKMECTNGDLYLVFKPKSDIIDGLLYMPDDITDLIDESSKIVLSHHIYSEESSHAI